MFLAIATGLAAMGTGIAQAIKGNQQRKATQRLIDDYQRQELKNYAVGIATPQLAYNLNNDQLQQQTADAYNQIAEAGARGLQMAGNVFQKSTQAQASNNASYEKSLYEMALEVAKNNMAIQSMQETRENADLQGLGTKLAAENATVTSGIQNAMSGLNGVVSGLSNGAELKAMKKMFEEAQKNEEIKAFREGVINNFEPSSISVPQVTLLNN